VSASAARALSPLRLARFASADAARWDRFVETCPEATFFHRAGWKGIIENVFGHEAFYLIAESSAGIEGVLPLGRVRSRLFGDALISVPFGVYGGVAALNEDARQLLEDEAERLAVELGVDYLEMRNRRAGREDWPTKELYVGFRKEIHEDPDENLKAIPRKQRAVVRKGITSGLEAELDGDVSRFFLAYATSVRNLGTPVYPKKYFQTLIDVFGDDSDILTITKDGRTVSSVMSFYFRDEVLPYYGGGTDEARALRANDFMYWELLKRSGERGCRVFDYGRSKVGTGAYSFKKNWGFAPEPLPYQYRLVKARAVPNVSPANPKYRLMVKAWRKLPVSLSTVIGPWVSRNIA
jgi:FemAB-related protein (PEP-CTERM system-associated)